MSANILTYQKEIVRLRKALGLGAARPPPLGALRQ